MLPSEDIDFLCFTALPEGLPGALLGTDDARVVYSRQMLTNKRQMVVKNLFHLCLSSKNRYLSSSSMKVRVLRVIRVLKNHLFVGFLFSISVDFFMDRFALRHLLKLCFYCDSEVL